MSEKPLHDNVSRHKTPSAPGRAVFVGLRALDVLWQYRLLTRGWASQCIERLGGHSIPITQILSSATSTSLTPYYTLVTLLSLGSSIKQIGTMLFISEQETPVPSAIAVAGFNTIFNSANTLLSVWSLTSQVPAETEVPLSPGEFVLLNPLLSLGVGAYILGILTETVSEVQRTLFKKDPANKGKPYGGGLFSLATNINYGGYTIWRAGYALICGGAAPAVVTFSFFFWDFATRGVPVLDGYLEDRYGQAYKNIKERVKYRLIPGVY
ncbi:uncharacterized protein DSM5745_04833 [Aspergillus mulundensis]|uniref:Uncharacterized protein n=1 Tax=Aspergillus mulundensis TaxID=1810919 RepID=A0A3D8S4U7_9EURO|nr:Uncharacterized protein DSM5745_04833 [Aspergillus mulundensis]RDW81276.1 Uncharacterized protein DSM5745_04833 [Aspergillus mulundensis]